MTLAHSLESKMKASRGTTVELVPSEGEHNVAWKQVGLLGNTVLVLLRNYSAWNAAATGALSPAVRQAKTRKLLALAGIQAPDLASRNTAA
jgi:hypothetical protein